MGSKPDLLRALRARMAASGGAAPDRVASGCDAIDRLLPGGGFARGTLVEWLGAGGCGATTLALLAAQRSCGEGRVLAIVDRQGRFYPPAAAALGIKLEELIIVRASSREDFDWALTQLLRSRAVASVVCWPDASSDRALRRWQLAAERGRTLGFLVRPESAASQASWADVRLRARPLASTGRARIRVELLRSRSAPAGRAVELELDDETRTLHLAPPVAAPTPVRRATGA